MHKDNLFELIRREEVVLWAGAGLSFYAGYPSGKKLAEILLDNLSDAEKKLIDANLLLPDLAEEYFRIKGNNKNSLLRVLKKTFLDIPPTSTETHDILSTIPHFKTIITTNYDKLIENSFREKSQTVLSSIHIPYLENEKTHIFKIHGDFLEPDSIIITKSDYNNFFKSNRENDIYWTVIKERLSTKSILFLGYNLEDPNTSVIFDKIYESLNLHRKECFLVSPKLPIHKINFLLQKGIQYIDSTAEELIKELVFNIKENVIEDLQNKKVSADTFRNFLTNINLIPDLKGKDNNYVLHKLNSKQNKIEGKLNLTFKNNPEFIKDFHSFIAGEKLGTFTITDDKLLNADLWYGGLKILNNEGLHKLELKSIPKIDTLLDIRFEKGFELTNVSTKVYSTKSMIEVHLKLNSATLIFNFVISDFPKVEYKFDYKHADTCNNVNEEIEFFTLLFNLGIGRKFTIFTKTGDKFSKPLPPLSALLNETKFLLKYFKSLKTIENHYNIRFYNINTDTINKFSLNKVKNIILSIKNKSLKYKWDKEIIMNLLNNSEESINQLKEMNNTNPLVVLAYPNEEIIELHGQNFNLGTKQVKIIDAYVDNLQQILDKKEQVARIKSKSKAIIIYYNKSDSHKEL